MISAEKQTQNLSREYSKPLLQKYRSVSKILPKIKKLLSKHQKFILTTHAGVDLDGLGSEVGMYFLLKKLGKKVVIINNERAPESMMFAINDVKMYNLEDDGAALESKKFADHFLLILDSSELHRSDRVSDFASENNLDYATIDHHKMPANPRCNIDITYAATCELVWDLYHYFKVEIPAKAALALYTGLSADTGNFRYVRTSMRTHLAAGHLISYGFSTDEVYRNIFESSPFDRHEYYRRILDKAIFNKEIGYVAGFVKQTMFKNLHLGDSPSEGIVNLLLGVQGVRIAALMTETPDKYMKCSLRSIDDIDVSSIAQKFGGGGHRNASGLYIREPFPRATKKVVAAIEEYLQTK